MESIRKSLGNRNEWRNTEGQLHREDGPAIEYADGRKSYYQNGKLHKEDGPALEWHRGKKKHWFLYDNELTEQEFNKFIAKKRINKLHERT